jgi:hypothetical protein
VPALPSAGIAVRCAWRELGPEHDVDDGGGVIVFADSGRVLPMCARHLRWCADLPLPPFTVERGERAVDFLAAAKLRAAGARPS